MPELAYVNGRILPIEDAAVPIQDRGYQFGDAVYEYITSAEGRLFMPDEHLTRLARSMKALAFPEVEMGTIRRAVQRLFEQGGFSAGDIYIQISRGVAPRNHAFPSSQAVQVVMTVRETKPYPQAMREQGIKAITVEDQRWGRCDIKTVQLLYNVLAKQKALDRQAYDAIFVGAGGVVREATSSNLFIVADSTVITHPLTRNILPGITRQCLMKLLQDRGTAAEERFFKTDELYAADEAFLSGTVTEVMPIVEIDGHPIGQGKVGPVAKALLADLHRQMRA